MIPEKLYHASPLFLAVGCDLLPASVTGNQFWEWEHFADEWQWRRNRVWLAATPAEAFGWVGEMRDDGLCVVYEVKASDDVAELEADTRVGGFDDGATAQYHCSSARILRVVPREVVRAEQRAALGLA